MWDRLEQIERRYRELDQEIARPEVAADLEQLRRLAQEKAGIEDTVAKYREYRATTRSLEETRAMLNDKLEEEMTALVKQEIENLELKQERLREELRLALLPRDASQ
jgi:peptide chain release factor 1